MKLEKPNTNSNGTREGTVEKSEEVVINKAGSFGTAVAIVDADVGCGRRGEHLALIFER